ncbi:MAG: hypothetical protein WB715_08320 [Roseiarcus sp.]|uniref:hypothetical protein n=1 Tax=Roseiarcus sp. TaxID=1969460 RepID=UPI003C64DC17
MPNVPHIDLEKMENYAEAKIKEKILAVTGWRRRSNTQLVPAQAKLGDACFRAGVINHGGNSPR